MDYEDSAVGLPWDYDVRALFVCVHCTARTNELITLQLDVFKLLWGAC